MAVSADWPATSAANHGARLNAYGTGKTTTVRMLASLIGSTSGEARIAGLRITNTRDSRKIRGLTGLLPEETGL